MKFCPGCGAVLWEFAPRLRKIAEYIQSRSGTTSADLVKRFGVSMANASNAIKTLEDNNLVVSEILCHPTGGRMKRVQWSAGKRLPRRKR